MSLVVTCGQCSARFKIDPALAGRSFKCRKCGAAIRAAASAPVSVSVPVGAASSPSTVPVAPRRSTTSDADPFANVDWSAVGGGFEEADRPSSSPSSYLPAVHSPLAPTGRRSTVVARPVRATAQSSAAPGFLGFDQKTQKRVIWLLVMGAVIILGIFIPVVGLVAGSVIGLAGFCFLIVGTFTMLATPFQEDTMCGLMYMFVPMYAFYYLVTRWYEMKTGFLQVVLGYALIIIGALTMVLSGGLAGAKARQTHSYSEMGMPSIHSSSQWVVAVSA